MVFEDPEDIAAQQGSADDQAWSGEGWTGNVGDHGNSIERSDQQVQSPLVQVDQVPSNSAGDINDDDDSGEYDPESVTITATPAPLPPPVAERSASATSITRSSKKPKTAGGFIIGSSDDEDDDTPAPTLSTQTLQPVPAPEQAHPSHQPSPQQSTQTHETTSLSSAQVGNGAVGLTADASMAAPASTKTRLPTDTIGILEDRIKEDPRGDVDAWLALIEEHKSRHKIEDTRAVYERFLKVFPQSAEIWVAYSEMELNLDNFNEAEAIFSRVLLNLPEVKLWTVYLNYIRRRNDVNNPASQGRQIVSQSYDFVLNNIGQDRDAGSLWSDYIHFIKTGPGDINGNNWQDKQKMDMLRKAYQRAICIPMANLNTFWKEYDQFELGLNRMAGRKFLQEKSPAYMTARTANTSLENKMRGLVRTTLPRLPPAPGFDGDQEYLEQVNLWKTWISWEKDDPLVIRTEDPATYQQRILHVYKHALMALRFWPEMWVDAAEWCFDNLITKDGKDTGLQFLIDGLAANPESSTLALKYADRIESTQQSGEDDEAKAALAHAVRAPYDTVLGTLYDMVKRLKERETKAIAKIEQDVSPSTTNNATAATGEDEDEGEVAETAPRETSKQERTKAVQDGFAVQIQMLSQQISYLWIALARAFRRLQGKGKSPNVGLRGIFTEARSKGRLTADVYIAIAHIEWEVYADPVATKIFDRGAKLFPESEHFFVEYLKHLHQKRDFGNAESVVAQAVKRWGAKPELKHKLKPLFAYVHSYESRNGELAKVQQLEKQMSELFPEEPRLLHFAARFCTETFNPIMARVIISPAQQMRLKMANVVQSVERPSPSVRSSPPPIQQIERSPRPHFLPATNSPKRPFQPDEQDDLANPPRKVARGVSPLKGAAGRRLDQQRRQGTSSSLGAPAPLPRDITFMLGLIPSADSFYTHRFNADGMVRLLQNTDIPDHSEWKSRNPQGMNRAHTRQASSEYPAFSYPGRDSPKLSGRPISPYNSGGRIPPQVSSTYRNSPLRPGSSNGAYEPPPTGYGGPGPSQFNPLAQLTQDNGYGTWQNGYGGQYGAPPQPQYGGYY
ncbi:hypothetical protein F5Y15DRAFT_405198 [Xylariaceae sp. FL0016]|nr:hypothetical protein F5Y15DRAFT_405198 [Xylariaceae sp. FL0016]